MRAAGAGPETVVGLCLDRGPELITAIVGTWLAGAAYLPLDPGYPPDRLAFMLADARAAILAGTSEALEEVPAGPGCGWSSLMTRGRWRRWPVRCRRRCGGRRPGSWRM